MELRALRSSGCALLSRMAHPKYGDSQKANAVAIGNPMIAGSIH
jgi:hypothetical protein